ncbi:MAG: SUMF1/EgtB/PvdO family nonheme iron enzyme [Polyangiaceae bacterium]|nr:SUMF1/EgtB/PvdO family nonheme iron enzyme [Polyangiaceae bacterium]
MPRAWWALLALAACRQVGGVYDDVQPAAPGAEAGAGGGSSPAAGASGRAGAAASGGASGSAGTGGAGAAGASGGLAGIGGAGAGGASGTGGAGAGNSGAAGIAGASGAGAGGAAGNGGGGMSGGAAGNAGAGMSGGAAGDAGAGMSGGAAGNAGAGMSGGAAGNAGAGMSGGAAGNAGAGMSGGAAGSAGAGMSGGAAGNAGGGGSLSCPVAKRGAALVWVAGTCVDRTEVTLEEFQAFVADGTYTPPPGLTYGSCASSPALRFQHVSGDPPGMPARGVTHCGARSYCDWAGKRLCGAPGGGVAQPTTTSSPVDDEWTRACMGGTAPRSYPYGTGFTATPQVCDDDVRFTWPVSCKDAGGCALEAAAGPTMCESPQGVLHLLGNVYEWTDACDEGASPITCALRGGSFTEFHSDVNCYLTRQQPVAETNPDVGLRCCATPL